MGRAALLLLFISLSLSLSLSLSPPPDYVLVVGVEGTGHHLISTLLKEADDWQRKSESGGHHLHLLPPGTALHGMALVKLVRTPSINETQARWRFCYGLREAMVGRSNAGSPARRAVREMETAWEERESGDSYWEEGAESRDSDTTGSSIRSAEYRGFSSDSVGSTIASSRSSEAHRGLSSDSDATSSSGSAVRQRRLSSDSGSSGPRAIVSGIDSFPMAFPRRTWTHPDLIYLTDWERAAADGVSSDSECQFRTTYIITYRDPADAIMSTLRRFRIGTGPAERITQDMIHNLSYLNQVIQHSILPCDRTVGVNFEALLNVSLPELREVERKLLDAAVEGKMPSNPGEIVQHPLFSPLMDVLSPHIVHPMGLVKGLMKMLYPTGRPKKKKSLKHTYTDDETPTVAAFMHKRAGVLWPTLDRLGKGVGAWRVPCANAERERER